MISSAKTVRAKRQKEKAEPNHSAFFIDALSMALLNEKNQHFAVTQ
jgi:hypothetical protein